jgi:hypothetical protein
MSESYWSKHHTGLIQCVLALYCAVLATLEYIHSRSAPAANPSPLPPPAGMAMNHGYSMPLYLLLGIIALCLSVAIPAIVGMIRKRGVPTKQFTPAPQVDRLKWTMTEAQLTVIYGRTFRNEVVELDGKKFDHCFFDNVTFLYHALEPTAFFESRFNLDQGKAYVLRTDNDAVKGFIGIQNSLTSLPGVSQTIVGNIDSFGNFTEAKK